MPQTIERKERFRIISVELPIEFYKEFDQAAKKTRTSKSEILRTALRSYLKQ